MLDNCKNHAVNRNCASNSVFSLVLTLALLNYVDGLVCGNRGPQSEKLTWEEMDEIHIQEGDILTMKVDRTLWIAYSKDELASIAQARGEKFAKVFLLDTRRLSNPDLLVSKVDVKFPPGWSKDHALELIRRLEEKQLPYGPRFCNGGHYMRYIIYAKRHASQVPLFLTRVCPLQRDLTGLAPEKIGEEDFYLLNDKCRKAVQINVDKDLVPLDPYFEYQRKKPLKPRIPKRLKGSLPLPQKPDQRKKHQKIVVGLSQPIEVAGE